MASVKLSTIAGGSGGGLKMSELNTAIPSAIVAPASGTLFTITPSASQYVYLTKLVTTSVTDETGITLTVGGRTIFTAGVVGNSNEANTIGSGSTPQSNERMVLGGKGEVFIVTKDAGSTGENISYDYVLLEDM